MTRAATNVPLSNSTVSVLRLFFSASSENRAASSLGCHVFTSCPAIQSFLSVSASRLRTKP